MNKVDAYVKEYEEACGKGGLFELRVRLLADKTANLQSLSGDRLEVVLNGIIAQFKAHLTKDESNLLTQARVLRNKVLHVDLEAAANKVGASKGGVKYFSNMPKEGADIMGFIEGIASGEIQGKVVRDHSAKSVGIFGWLLECGKNGTFTMCHDQLVQASEIIWRLTAVE